MQTKRCVTFTCTSSVAARWAGPRVETVGCLYVVPTPIGNLEDITMRSLRVLREVPLILAEDTRHTRKLLSHFGISTPMQSYHQHNKVARIEPVLQLLHEHDLALVSDAGMPGVSDPGFELIEAVVAAGLSVDVLPGPSAVITAVVAAALPGPGFLFLGFPPRKQGERVALYERVAALPYLLVFYEAPHRLLPALRDMARVWGDRPVAVMRELTKVHQEVWRGGLLESLSHFEAQQPRGEFTLVVGGGEAQNVDRTDEARDFLQRLRDEGVETRSAVSRAVEEYGVSRNVAYRMWLQLGSQ